MTLFSLMIVLFIEQIRPLPYRAIVHGSFLRLARFLEERFNGGEARHGVIAWCVGVGGLVLLSGGIYVVLQFLSPVLAWLWNILILYLALGFRQFSHFYTDIQLALRMNDLPHARALLAEWQIAPVDDSLSAVDIARLAIRQALMASHLHVFGVLLCFVLLPGPCGAVLYRVAALFSENWGVRANGALNGFGRFSQRAFAVIDWLPARLTASGFAIVGNFENAVYGWRTWSNVSSHWTDPSLGDGLNIVLVTGAGALGVRLDTVSGGFDDGAIGDGGDETGIGFMQSAVGLVWRALLLWLLLLLLLTLAGLVGA